MTGGAHSDVTIKTRTAERRELVIRIILHFSLRGPCPSEVVERDASISTCLVQICRARLRLIRLV
jgi:hypothetical protein